MLIVYKVWTKHTFSWSGVLH